MSTLTSSLVIPDSLLAKDATDILREHSTELLFNHSTRVDLFAAEQGRQQELRFDPERLYVAAAFHDLGLIKKFSSQNERFEVGGANAAPQFLTAHNVPEEQVQTVWQAIALHTRCPGTRALSRCSGQGQLSCGVICGQPADRRLRHRHAAAWVVGAGHSRSALRRQP